MMLVNPYWFSEDSLGVWESACIPTSAHTDEGGRRFICDVAGFSEVAYINRPKSTGKWFWAFELAPYQSASTFHYAGGLVKTSNINTNPRASVGVPNANEVCYGSFLGPKKWVFGVQSVYGTAGVNGDVLGISYDANTGDVRGYNWNGSSWIDQGLLTTVTANTSMCPVWMAPGAGSFPGSRIRSDILPPTGFIIWV